MKHHWNWPFAILIYIAAHSTITAQPPTPRYVASTDFNSDILVAYITRVEKVGNNIFLLDMNAGKVHILDDSFRYLKPFDPESYHPGVPFPDKKEFVRLRHDATANQIEVGNTYNAVQQLIGKHIVADIRKINDRYAFINVSDSKNKRNLFYSCDLSFDKCFHMPNDEKGVVMYIGPNEMIKMSRSDEQLQFHRYSLR